MQIRLSKHFIENWRKRVGNTPSAGAVIDIIYDSIKIQDGKRFGKEKTLSYYWHPELSLILAIDHFTGTAVSVLSEAVYKPKNKHKNGCKKQRSFRPAGYVRMTMHAGV